MTEQDTRNPACGCEWAVEPESGLEIMATRYAWCPVHGDHTERWKRIQARARELAEQLPPVDEAPF